MYDIIVKKRDGYSLSKEEIDYFIENYTNGNIPDYQASALLMAIYFNKMDKEETLNLTKAVINSGDTFDLSNIKGIKVDKHSTGGVGDTATLVLGPMVAACGVPFVKMSGRGLGHTGGTLDKLEAIEGFRVELTNEEFERNANEINLSICSQTGNITPADKKLYALRDVTGTVENLSLIAASIMGKKLAIESDAIVLDVKIGSGAFMKNLDDATNLAREMVHIGNSFGRKTLALVTNMDEPLGNAIGNTLEVIEAINTLKGHGPEDLLDLCLALGAKLLILAKKTDNEDEARKMLEDTITSGRAIEKLKEMIDHQGGNSSYVDNTDLFDKAQFVSQVKAPKSGYIREINAEEVGKCALILGAGRETKDSIIDLTAGLILKKKVDDLVNEGDVLVEVYSNDMAKASQVEKRLLDIYKIGEKNPLEKKLILGQIE